MPHDRVLLDRDVPPALRVVSFMRAPFVVAALALLVHAAPAADAREVACADAVRPSCPGFACVDADLDGRLEGRECMVVDCLHAACLRPLDLDACAFRTDCCGGPPGSPFWCPEDG